MSQASSASQHPVRTETVLVVDDDVRVVELLQITLGGRGYQVLSAYDGETALKTIRSQGPDLVVLDVRLPRKSGFEVLEALRDEAAFRALPIVLISANAATETRLQGLRLGADDYLTKPFSPRELIMKIRRLLDRAEDRQVLSLKNEVLEDEVRRSRASLHEMHSEMTWNLNRMGVLLGQVLEMNEAFSVDRVLERFVATTVGGLDYERMALLTASADAAVAPVISRGISESALKALRFRPGGFVLRVLQSVERPMRIDEFDAYPEAGEEIQRLAAAGLSLLVPALHEHNLRAVLGLGDRRHGLELTRFDWKLLEILGHSIASALRNVEVFGETQRSFLETTATLVGAVESRYPFMSGHSERVKELSLALGRRLVLPETEMEALRFGALLHDVGELPSYQELLERPVHLSRDERVRHRIESLDRARRLVALDGDGLVAQILRYQHEWWDGTGLPEGRRGEEIPLGARVVALANAWDALGHDRPQRPGYEAAETRRILEGRAGTQFDPELVPLLLAMVEAETNETVGA